MGKSELTITEATAMFLHVAASMLESENLLTQADKAVGDGDHGIGMSRGFAAVQAKLESAPPATVADLLKTTGMALITSVGGASGVIFGTLYRGGARNMGAETVFDAGTLARMLGDGLAAVQERGKAKPGAKTMVDALAPAAATAAEMADSPLDQALPPVAEAARLGLEKTKEMIAATGKAMALGPRALGHVDPGAVSRWLMLKAMAEYVVDW